MTKTGKMGVLGLVLILGMSLQLVGCRKAAPEDAREFDVPVEGGILRVALGTDVPIFDSAYASGLPNLGIIHLVTEGLVKLDSETGNVIPHLAERWSVSDDGLVWTIKLRPNVKFHDGTAFDAQAVKFNIDRLLNPDTKALTRSFWQFIKEVKVVDPLTVDIITHDPFGPFMRQFTYAPMAMNSPTQVTKLGNEDYHTAPVGTGPFKFVEHVRGQHVKVVRNEEYWGGKPPLEGVVTAVMPEAGARIMALETGEVDVAYHVPPRDVQRLEQNPDIQVVYPPSQRIMHVGFNHNHGPLKDVRVRQALNYAVNKHEINQVILLGRAHVLDSPLPPTAFGYVPTMTYEFNPQKAKQLLQEAGYPGGFTIKLMYTPGRYLMDTEVVEAVQSYLAAVGVKVEIVSVEWAVQAAARRLPLAESTTEMYFLGWGCVTLDGDIGFQSFTTAAFAPGMNTMFYSNEEVDRLFLKGRQSVDPAERLAAYEPMQRLIMEDAPILFLYVEPQIHAVRANARGVEISVNEMIFLDKAWLAR
ncbi:MAG: ABC transporter substrate-binding protein [bacterium]|nr:ABC transporter substrate-binding protein [bacterium]